MRFAGPLFLTQLLICFNYHGHGLANPMFGPNVQETSVDEFPYVASLFRTVDADEDPTEAHFCSGVLVTRQDVLTVSDCLNRYVSEEMGVRLGTNDLSRATKYSVKWTITYDIWAQLRQGNIDFQHCDFGNVRLATKVPEDFKLIEPAFIPPEDLFDKTLIVAAWGRDSSNTTPLIKRKVELQVLNTITCRRNLRTLSNRRLPVDTKTICAYARPYAILNHGDNGAPLMLDGKVVALHTKTSPWPSELLNTNNINLNTVINAYRIFIYSTNNPNFMEMTDNN